VDKNYFEVLNSINVNDKTEKKNNLTYLSWAWAWGEVKKLHPNAIYTIYENSNGLFYHTDGKTCWVKTGVTINGLEHIEYLPVMDFRNQSIPSEKVTSFDVNKAIQRSLTKAVARHGLGLYIYAGEDLPEDGEQTPPQKAVSDVKDKYDEMILKCSVCGKEVSIKEHDYSISKYKKVLCRACQK
jgi:DNA-directed RNA polymerase subunit RPC12/RpoP